MKKAIVLKNMEAMSLEKIEMVSGGNYINTENRIEAGKEFLADPFMRQSFVWIKNKPRR